VAVTLSRQPHGLACLIVDSGVSLPDGVIPAGLLPGMADVALEDLPEGGFGWYLIRSLTRDLAYTRDQGVNRLSFILPDVGRDR
jgi:serine/threonine-protein kinase RsbW